MSRDCAPPGRMRRRFGRLGSAPEVPGRGELDEMDGELEPASVLIPCFERDGRMWVVFTHRAAHLENHSGEVSFPGGRVEPQDADRRETALREAYEEIELTPAEVTVYGVLTELPTVTGFHIRAYVGEFDGPSDLTADPGEIESIFAAPLCELADPSIHRLERREWRGQTFEVHFYEYDGYTIWGATGYVLWVLLDYLDLV